MGPRQPALVADLFEPFESIPGSRDCEGRDRLVRARAHQPLETHEAGCERRVGIAGSAVGQELVDGPRSMPSSSCSARSTAISRVQRIVGSAPARARVEQVPRAAASLRSSARRPAACRCSAARRAAPGRSPAELVPVTNRLFEMPAGDLVKLRASRRRAPRARRRSARAAPRASPSAAVVGGVADQQMAEAESVVVVERRRVRADQLLAHESGQPGSSCGGERLVERARGPRGGGTPRPRPRRARATPAPRPEPLETCREQRLDRRRNGHRPAARARAPPSPRGTAGCPRWRRSRACASRLEPVAELIQQRLALRAAPAARAGPWSR